MPAFELLVRDINQPIKNEDIDVIAFMSPEECTPATTKNLFGKVLAMDNTSMLHSWTCRALVEAAADPTQKLAFIPTLSSAKQPSALATALALPASPTGRRYAALVDWHIENVSSTSSCSFIACVFSFTMSSEIAVVDRLDNKLIWHSIQNIPSAIFSDHYDEKTGPTMGPEAISRALIPVLAENQAQRRDAAGLLRSTAMEADPAVAPTGTALNTKANLIIFNDYSNISKHSSDAYYGRPYHLKAQHLPEKTNFASYNAVYKSYVALQLVPGKYEVSFTTEPYSVDIEAGGAPVYLRLSRGLFNKTNVDRIDAAQALTLALKSTNLLLPEATPASHPQRARPVYWTQP
ncbi:hypothetical protein [Janthinobacterium sp. LB2P10]|uniref:hypothetical protein n=1 Tax=Janthinobacterium sp. LB2P10 TaxID=3424194 RepID=UPI003F238AEC